MYYQTWFYEVAQFETYSQQISAGDNALQNQQELSYRKQIARQLRTQYVEGIYNKPMTLKSRLRVTQGY